jgi:hypothetical protein
LDKLDKHSSDETASPRRWPSYLPVLTAALSVLIATLLIVATYPVFSQTYDEPAHLAAGMEWLDRGSYSYEAIHPPLARIAVALGPYLAGTRSQGNASIWDEGNALLEYQGHYQRTLTLARLGILPFFWLACFVLWRFVSRNYGHGHAALAVVLFVFCPPILANASVATTDLPFTAMFLLAFVCFWNFLQEPKSFTAVLAGFTMALAVLCKFTALPYLGVSCVVLYVYCMIEKRPIPPWKYIGIGGVTVALIIWAGYRFSVGPILHQGQVTPFEMAHLRGLSDTLARAFFFPGVPAPEFFKGLAHLFALSEKKRLAYLFGETYLGGTMVLLPGCNCDKNADSSATPGNDRGGEGADSPQSPERDLSTRWTRGTVAGRNVGPCESGSAACSGDLSLPGNPQCVCASLALAGWGQSKQGVRLQISSHCSSHLEHRNVCSCDARFHSVFQ